MNWKKRRRILAYPYLVWLAILIVAPMIMIIYYALTGQIDGKIVFSLEYIKKAFEPIYLKVLGHSILLAVAATLISLVLGFPIAAILSKKTPKMAAILSMFFVLPMWMNFLLRTYAWMVILDSNGIINQFLSLWLSNRFNF